MTEDRPGLAPPPSVDDVLSALEDAELRPWRLLLPAMLQRRSYGVQTATAQLQIVGKRHYGRKALPPGGGGGRAVTRELPDTLLLNATSAVLLLLFVQMLGTITPLVLFHAPPLRAAGRSAGLEAGDRPLALLKDASLLKTDALINGEWVKGTARFDVHDPSTGAKLADVANLGPKEAEAAIAAANAAWPAWRKKTARERSLVESEPQLDALLADLRVERGELCLGGVQLVLRLLELLAADRAGGDERLEPLHLPAARDPEAVARDITGEVGATTATEISNPSKPPRALAPAPTR